MNFENMRDFQVIVLGRRQYDMVPVAWITILKDKDVHEVCSLFSSQFIGFYLSNQGMIIETHSKALIMIPSFSFWLQFFSMLLPATISLSLAQVASFTDLCLASLIPGAAAALSCMSVLCVQSVHSPDVYCELQLQFSKQFSTCFM